MEPHPGSGENHTARVKSPQAGDRKPLASLDKLPASRTPAPTAGAKVQARVDAIVSGANRAAPSETSTVNFAIKASVLAKVLIEAG